MKSVKISEDDHKYLMRKKLDWGEVSIGEVIHQIVEGYRLDGPRKGTRKVK